MQSRLLLCNVAAPAVCCCKRNAQAQRPYQLSQYCSIWSVIAELPLQLLLPASTLEKPSGSKKPSGAVTPGKSCALMQTLEGAAERATASFAPLKEAGANATALQCQTIKSAVSTLQSCFFFYKLQPLQRDSPLARQLQTSLANRW